MHSLIKTAVFAFVMVACKDELTGPGNQLGRSSKTSSESGSYVESNASDGTAGSMIFIPSGSDIDGQKIRIEEGASVANQTTAAYLSIPGAVAPASASVMITHEEYTYIENPGSLVISLPINAEEGALRLINGKYLVVFYHVFSSNKGDLVYGAIPTANITVESNMASFEFAGFGAYQLAYVESPVEVAMKSPTTSAVISKSGEVVKFQANTRKSSSTAGKDGSDDATESHTLGLKTWSVKDVPTSISSSLYMVPAISPSGAISVVVADQMLDEGTKGYNCALIHRDQIWSDPVCMSKLQNLDEFDFILSNSQVLVSDDGAVAVLMCGATGANQSQNIRYAYLPAKSNSWSLNQSSINNESNLSCGRFRLESLEDGTLTAFASTSTTSTAFARYHFFTDRPAEVNFLEIAFANTTLNGIHFSMWNHKPFVGAIDSFISTNDDFPKLKFFDLSSTNSTIGIIDQLSTFNVPKSWMIDATAQKFDFAWSSLGPEAMLWRGNVANSTGGSMYDGSSTIGSYFVRLDKDAVLSEIKLPSTLVVAYPVERTILNKIGTEEYLALLQSMSPDNQFLEWHHIKNQSIVASEVKTVKLPVSGTVEFLRRNWVINSQDSAIYVFSLFYDTVAQSEVYVAHSFANGKWQGDYHLRSAFGGANFNQTSNGNIVAVTREGSTSDRLNQRIKLYTLSH